MMHLVLLLAAAALVCDCQAASLSKNFKMLHFNVDSDLSLKANAPKRSLKKFVHIITPPPSVIKHIDGSTVEVTCEAIGSPVPSIRWFRNNQPLPEHDQESTDLSASSASLGRLSSSILITKPTGNIRDVYTCFVRSGSKTEMATSTVYYDEPNTLLSERNKLLPLEPRILVSYAIYMEESGQDVFLPCRVKGHPRPKIEWIDNKGKVVRNDRMKVLRTGDLFIPNLSWEDMGEYTCKATNVFGTKSKATFVYPVKAG